MTKSSFRRPRAVDAAGGAVARSTGDNGNAPGCLFCLSVRCSIVVTVSSSYRACDCDLFVTTPSLESVPVDMSGVRYHSVHHGELLSDLDALIHLHVSSSAARAASALLSFGSSRCSARRTGCVACSKLFLVVIHFIISPELGGED